MGNIITYTLDYGRQDMEELPFNEVDALLLCQFCYLKLEGIVPSFSDARPPVRLCGLPGRMDEAKVFLDKRFEKDNRALFAAMVTSRRFRDMGLNFYSDIVSETAETQFSALTVFPEKGPAVALFRGTDETLVGWKEDFNMCLSAPVMGQELSALYLNRIGEALEGGFLVAGHSKGGNFAVYAAMNAEDGIQDRIGRVYSFDGPGFRPEILAGVDFGRIKDRISKFLPHSCMVGMLLQSQEAYRVVECSNLGFLQHYPYNWHVEGAGFKELEEVAIGSKIFNETVNQWLGEMDEEELKDFCGLWYEIARSAKVKDLLEVASHPARTMHSLLAAARLLEEGQRKMARRLAGRLLQLTRENLKKAGAEALKGAVPEGRKRPVKKGAESLTANPEGAGGQPAREGERAQGRERGCGSA